MFKFFINFTFLVVIFANSQVYAWVLDEVFERGGYKFSHKLSNEKKLVVTIPGSFLAPEGSKSENLNERVTFRGYCDHALSNWNELLILNVYNENKESVLDMRIGGFKNAKRLNCSLEKTEENIFVQAILEYLENGIKKIILLQYFSIIDCSTGFEYFINVSTKSEKKAAIKKLKKFAKENVKVFECCQLE